jgi:hypothetical protein
MRVATQPGGHCEACTAFTGSAFGCAVHCAACVNELDAFLSSCAGNFTMLNYGK